MTNVTDDLPADVFPWPTQAFPSTVCILNNLNSKIDRTKFPNPQHIRPPTIDCTAEP